MNSDSCSCREFGDLELWRKEISARGKVTPKLLKQFVRLAKQKEGDSDLFKCPSCGQHWQASSAWNWGALRYAFKVPEIEVSSWLEKPFMKPDELLIYAAEMEQVNAQLQTDSAAGRCRIEDCPEPCVRFSIHCRRHHIESLQSIGQLTSMPQGRWFPPYGRLVG